MVGSEPRPPPWPCVPWQEWQARSTKSFFPRSAEPFGASCANAAPAQRAAAKTRTIRIVAPLAQLADHVDQGRRAALHDLERALQCRSERIRVADRPFAVYAEGLRELSEIHLGIVD